MPVNQSINQQQFSAYPPVQMTPHQYWAQPPFMANTPPMMSQQQQQHAYANMPFAHMPPMPPPMVPYNNLSQSGGGNGNSGGMHGGGSGNGSSSGAGGTRSGAGHHQPDQSVSPSFPSACVTPTLPPHVNSADVRVGVGVIKWLSTQAGLIESHEFGTVSFQLKAFCDQQVSDLTSVIRPGYRLKFKATPSSTGEGWNATFVVPVQTHEHHLAMELTAEIEKTVANGDTGPPQLARDPYDLPLETRAIPMLLSIFERQANAHCQLSGFHCHISNCGDDALYRYVGTSSLKRRQFLERRTHLFHIDKNDLVSLQPACIYDTVYLLHTYLLSRGGACLLQELWDYFNNSPTVEIDARETIGEGKRAFLNFLNTHTWIMSVFPSKVFVSVRRQLPNIAYADFINTHFPDQDWRASPSTRKANAAAAAAAASSTAGSKPASRVSRDDYGMQQQQHTKKNSGGGGDEQTNGQPPPTSADCMSPWQQLTARNSGSSADHTPPPQPEFGANAGGGTFWQPIRMDGNMTGPTPLPVRAGGTKTASNSPPQLVAAMSSSTLDQSVLSAQIDAMLYHYRATRLVNKQTQTDSIDDDGPKDPWSSTVHHRSGGASGVVDKSSTAPTSSLISGLTNKLSFDHPPQAYEQMWPAVQLVNPFAAYNGMATHNHHQTTAPKNGMAPPSHPSQLGPIGARRHTDVPITSAPTAAAAYDPFESIWSGMGQ